MSRRIYCHTVEARLKGDCATLPRPDPQTNQYFPLNGPFIKKPSHFVDCGAFDGDTLKRLNGNFGKIDRIVAFEPGLENFARLVKCVRGMNLADEILLCPCGVWSSTRQLRFYESGAASSISEDAESVIQCVALDEILQGFVPTHIKMDIEGAEYQGLLGARETVQRCLPDLAVCLYHRPEHLWQIPLLIRRWHPGYKLYLRQYGYSGFDLVMYACTGDNGG